MGTKRSVLTDEHGLPLSVVLDGANRHDIKLLEETLDGIVTFRPDPTQEQNPNFKARLWVVEVTHSFFNRFRKLLVRFEKKAVNYIVGE